MIFADASIKQPLDGRSRDTIQLALSRPEVYLMAATKEDEGNADGGEGT